MIHYIGTKHIKAQPMTRAEFVAYRYPNQEPNPDAGAPDDEGYLVEYTDGGQPNHLAHAGYISWSPKAQFDAAYLSLGDISHLKPHEQRVVGELEQLDDKVKKLEAFLATPACANLPHDDRELLKMQATAMVHYLSILSHRVERFGGAK
ncbi:crAss001_48 related protein [Agrobacterium tumefaciens]|uniref:crAss001_48 related protein n=1 Tax=Agrobacterium tumefaciens TaxID=358 RepID=UPI0015741E6A|nr:hypothetical protein [Agrobacterium tumefaciens]